MTDIEQDLRDAMRQWLAAGRTQQELAELAGRPQGTVSTFLRGEGITLRAAKDFSRAIKRPLRLGGRGK